jgi:ElaB/YqjD/DUF883 family membrane-anchored ribosome-binding protein
MSERKGKSGPVAARPPASAAAAAAHRTIDDVRRLLEEARNPEEIAARTAEVQERLRAALDAVEAAATHAVSALREPPQALTDELAEAERRIRDNPFGAVLVAAGVGLLAGLILGRR